MKMEKIKKNKKSNYFYIFDKRNKRRYRDKDGLIPHFNYPIGGENYIEKRLKSSPNFILRREN